MHYSCYYCRLSPYIILFSVIIKQPLLLLLWSYLDPCHVAYSINTVIALFSEFGSKYIDFIRLTLTPFL